MPQPRPIGHDRHPIHALLGAFPIVCFTGALVTDIAYARSARMEWADFSAWLLAAGLVMGALAIVAGIVDGLLHRRERRSYGVAGAVHGIGNLLVMLLALWNMFVQSRDAWTSVVPTGITLSVVTVLVMALTGIVGWSLTARRPAYQGATL